MLLERTRVSEYIVLCFPAPETHLSWGLGELHTALLNFRSCLGNALPQPEWGLHQSLPVSVGHLHFMVEGQHSSDHGVFQRKVIVPLSAEI